MVSEEAALPELGRRSAKSVLAVIVTYNSEYYIGGCLNALKEQSCEVEIVVYDNNSQDQTCERVRCFSPPVELIAGTENLGFAAAVNIGATSTDGSDYILLVNPDCVVERDALQALLTRAQAYPLEGVWGACSYDTAGRIDTRSCLAEPNLWHAITFGLGLSLLRWPPFLRPDSLGGWPRTGEREVPALTGALLLIDRGLWHRLGGFDETFFMFGEDVDFSLRARRAGARPTFTGTARFAHVGSASFSDAGDRRAMLLAARANLYQRYAAIPKLAELLLLTGAGLRAVLEWFLRPTRTEWREAWRRRNEWRHGWPLATANCAGHPASDAAELA